MALYRLEGSACAAESFDRADASKRTVGVPADDQLWCDAIPGVATPPLTKLKSVPSAFFVSETLTLRNAYPTS